MLLSEQSLMENLVDGAHDVYYNDVDNGDVPGLVSTIENPLNTSEAERPEQGLFKNPTWPLLSHSRT